MSKRKQALIALMIVIVGLGAALLIPGVRHLLINYNNDKAFALMNRDRVNNSPYRALRHSSQLQAYAQNWANHMAKSGVLEHDSIRKHFCCPSTLGENVGTGPTIEDIEQAFMISKPHRFNIVYPYYTEAGVAVAISYDRHHNPIYWVDQAFRASSNRASRSTQRSKPTPTRSKLIHSPSATPTLVFTPPPITATGVPLPPRHRNAARIVFATLIVLGAGLFTWFVYTLRRR